MNMAAKTKKVYKHIKKPMNIAAKTEQDQTAHEHSSKMIKGCKHIEKPMSRPAKTQNMSKNP